MYAYFRQFYVLKIRNTSITQNVNLFSTIMTQKIQFTLPFRYGREDEELMGLRFCNEVVIASQHLNNVNTETRRTKLPLGKKAVKVKIENEDYFIFPFALTLGHNALPSLRLVPCRPYHGAPIGTMYEVQLYMAPQVQKNSIFL